MKQIGLLLYICWITLSTSSPVLVRQPTVNVISSDNIPHGSLSNNEIL